MKRIYKYPIEITDVQNVMLPFGAEILCVQFQQEQLCLWAIVNDNTPEPRTIYIFGTGHDMDDTPRRYIGTVQQHGGALIWHVFER